MARKFKLGKFSKVEFIRLNSNFASLCSNKSNKILLEAIFYRSLETLSLCWWDSCPPGNNNSRRCFRTIFHFTLKVLLSPFFSVEVSRAQMWLISLFFCSLPPIIKMNCFYNSFSHNFHIHTSTYRTLWQNSSFCSNIWIEFLSLNNCLNNIAPN